jgi:hypothetical protein
MEFVRQFRRDTYSHRLRETRRGPYNGARNLQRIGCALRRNLTKPPANVLELPLEEPAEVARKAAVEKVIAAHAREGLPIYIWRGGRVIEMSLEELREHSARIHAE